MYIAALHFTCSRLFIHVYLCFSDGHSMILGYKAVRVYDRMLSCIGFTRWLNHILTPADEYGHLASHTKRTGELQSRYNFLCINYSALHAWATYVYIVCTYTIAEVSYTCTCTRMSPREPPVKRDIGLCAVSGILLYKAALPFLIDMYTCTCIYMYILYL